MHIQLLQQEHLRITPDILSYTHKASSCPPFFTPASSEHSSLPRLTQGLHRRLPHFSSLLFSAPHLQAPQSVELQAKQGVPGWVYAAVCSDDGLAYDDRSGALVSLCDDTAITRMRPPLDARLHPGPSTPNPKPITHHAAALERGALARGFNTMGPPGG